MKLVLDQYEARRRRPITSTGFTMIELLVVVSLSVILMLATSTLFLTFLLGRTKVTAIKSIKDEGQYALGRIEFLIRNAVEVVGSPAYPTGCELGMESFTFRSLDGELTTFFSEIDPSDNREKIASNSGIYLTSDQVDLIEGPIFDCTQPADETSQHVEVFFTLRRGTPGVSSDQEIAESEFKTSVTVRSL